MTENFREIRCAQERYSGKELFKIALVGGLVLGLLSSYFLIRKDNSVQDEPMRIEKNLEDKVYYGK